MLEIVKNMLGVTGTYQNATIQAYIDEVKQFMLDGGVDENIVNSQSSAGVIARGVADLWNYGSGQGKFSRYFMQRVVQLSYAKVTDSTIPEDPTTLIVRKGDTLIRQIGINQNGEAYVPSEGDSIQFILKESNNGRVLIEKSIPTDSLLLRLDAEETKLLPINDDPLVYAIRIMDDDGIVETFISGKVYMLEGIY